MARRDLFNRDASSHAASELEYIIHNDDKYSSVSKIKTVSAEQAMEGSRVFKTSSNRDITRVLFISRNTELLNPTQQSLDGYVDISELFDEVHILILRQGIIAKNPVLRASDNVWVYTASADFWWLTPFAGLRMVKEQLEFASGFRPDLIVARDPFESAVVAHRLAKKYDRASQLHILDDYSTKDFIQKSTHNFWRRFIPYFTVPRFSSVRTLTHIIKSKLEEKFEIPDLKVLPRYQNYEALIDSKAHINLSAKYKPFVFTMLFVGNLSHESTLHKAMDAANFALKNPRVGMIVIGDGLALNEFRKRAKAIGIERQVVFEPKISDIIPYMKSANMMIVTDTDSRSEELVIKGAAAGIPMVMTRTDNREDIFTHGESAFLCEHDEIQEFTDRINDMLNDIDLRKKFTVNGQSIIKNKFHHDPTEYQESYRLSIEEAFFQELKNKESGD